MRQAHADNTTHFAGASHNGDVTRVPSLLYLFLIPLTAYPFARLTPEAARAFDRYAESVEAEMNNDLEFEKIKLRGGEVRIDSGKTPPDIEGGMIQDWRGAMFLPHATIQKVKTVLQDYDG